MQHGLGTKVSGNTIYQGQFLLNKAHGYGLMASRNIDDQGRTTETAGVFKEGNLIERILPSSEKSDRVSQVLQKVPNIPKTLK